MNNELQNEEFILKGDLGMVNRGGRKGKITKVFKGKDGATTVTITPEVETPPWTYTKGINHYVDKMMFPEEFKEPVTEDADFEIITPKELPQSPHL